MIMSVTTLKHSVGMPPAPCVRRALAPMSRSVQINTITCLCCSFSDFTDAYPESFPDWTVANKFNSIPNLPTSRSSALAYPRRNDRDVINSATPLHQSLLSHIWSPRSLPTSLTHCSYNARNNYLISRTLPYLPAVFYPFHLGPLTSYVYFRTL